LSYLRHNRLAEKVSEKFNVNLPSKFLSNSNNI
jgi:hypothetical protein